MKIELVQLRGRDGDTAYNLASALQAIANCAPGTDLLVFPETHLMGFPTSQTVAELAEPLDGPTVRAVQQAVSERNVSVAIGMAENEGGVFYNTTLLITPAGIAMRYRKTHLWSSDRGIFTPGDRYVTVPWQGIRVGILICFDIEFPESARALAQLGVDLIIVTNGNMDPYGPTHRTAIMARAMENQAFAVMVNRVGSGDGDLLFAGGSCAVDPFGRLLYEAGREECRQVVELDLDQLQAACSDYRYLEERRLVLPGERIDYPDGRRELLIPR
ncbi:carbon-nitrogen hydrolase family protein [Phytopseudomonas dryadis]|uniref:Carbon-nitrogen hydrolase n=1 Tax=Phytopseudomonas dryadis TaxID=2487520 RepID=A0A4Q9R4Y7_9GAMM|nr:MULTISPECIES: carbon-nitrogen hydrolase family protein [Pseudomonas]TBU95586.1 carbon-nitrogen hydrolase [Pseudomonas dryadis]TBV01341.1 carbon-nitrogen hydrolase [Pseudomonas dryadis]TBV14096.1 carbon-nitrogen hydrolase [Pseudomonas sp. FRB 230]